jgi:hypothetical protein
MAPQVLGEMEEKEKGTRMVEGRLFAAQKLTLRPK